MFGSLSPGSAFGEMRPIDESRSVGGSLVREIVAVVAIVVLADVTIYRGHGYTGLAAFSLGFMVLLVAGKRRRVFGPSVWLVAGMLALLAVRLVWYGSPLQVAVGACLIVIFATAVDGQKPFLLNAMAMASQTLVAGHRALEAHVATLKQSCPTIARRKHLNVIFPVLAFLLFAGLFVLANPDVVSFVVRQFSDAFRKVSDWFVRAALRPTEPLFWLVVAWITAGLMRPMLRLTHKPKVEVPPSETVEASLYPAFRNTLLTVIALFTIYLVYEFYALWNRDFPEGFYYAGYAHEGAAWLTIALAFATLILSLVFSGRVLQDPRLPKLRRLAWVWSLQNLLLSVAVFNRLFIYIDFNGMTRMRIIGLFGTSVVVAGFVLVVWKIIFAKDFPWLVHRQCWALGIAIYLYALTPVDRIAASYNVQRILDGDLSASMQIGVQKLDLEGTLALFPLLECKTAIVREGAAALIADRYSTLQDQYTKHQQAGWTAYQWSDRAALDRIESVRGQWRSYEDAEKRQETIQRFYNYAYQWY